MRTVHCGRLIRSVGAECERRIKKAGDVIDYSSSPRFSLMHGPTPLEPAVRLAAALRDRGLRVPRLWIKRDDCTGLALGGNKTRKLEFLIGEAMAQGAPSVLTVGATQSNHARQTAAAAAKAGLACHLLLEHRIEGDADYEESGNVLLDEMLGAQVTHLPNGVNLRDEADARVRELADAGESTYLIVGGGSSPLGALGYVRAAEEIHSQLPDASTIIHATGSMGTQAGLIAGLAMLESATHVVGVSVRQQAFEMTPVLSSLASDTAHLLGGAPIDDSRIEVDDRWVGEGYGIPTSAMIDAVRLLAHSEGILLDPVYSGKAFAGMVGMISEGRFTEDEDVVFLHTGGTPALFAYKSTFMSV